MKTDKKIMAKIYRKKADNLDKGLNRTANIQFLINITHQWEDMDSDIFYNDVLYRIKPETITLKNGVTIPKPLDYQELKDGKKYYFPVNDKYLYGGDVAQTIKLMEVNFIYTTEEQAIEASKSLFGIE